jgi:hypothetical protein
MKKINILTLTLLTAIFVLVGASCSTGPTTIKNTSSVGEEESSEIVKEYMKYTLGSVPGVSVEYDKAKTLLTPELRKQFKDSMFVPISYCIQNGPDDVRIVSTKTDEKMKLTNVVVEAKYDNKWKKMWNFKTVLVEGKNWKIDKINCLQ